MSEDYSYVTVCAVRDKRSTTGPPSFKPSEADYEYAYRPRANALPTSAKSLGIETTPRKQSEPFVHTLIPCFQDQRQLNKEFQTKLDSKKKDLMLKTPTHNLDTKTGTSPISETIPRSKSVENLDNVLPFILTKIPVETVKNSNLSKNKSSSMNILNKRKISIPNTSATINDKIKSHLQPPYIPNTSDEENIYEDIDDQTKLDIVGNTDYVTFDHLLSLSEHKVKIPETRPPAPLPISVLLNLNMPNTLPTKKPNTPYHNPLTSVAKHKTAPVLANKPNLEGRLSAKTVDKSVLNSPGDMIKPKPLIGKKSSKKSLPLNKEQQTSKKPSKETSKFSNLARNPSFNFSLPLAAMTDSMDYVTSVPLYSLQRSEDFTSEFSKMNKLYANVLEMADDSDMSDDEANSYDMNSLPRDMDARSFLIDTSLPSIDSSDYTTYDKILNRISRFSKKATTKEHTKLRATSNLISTDYVTYDHAMASVARTRSFDLEGYITTGEVLHRQQNADLIQEVNYVNAQQQTKGTRPKPISPRPNKIPQPSPRDPQSPIPTPRFKPSGSSTPNKSPNAGLFSLKSFDDPEYIECVSQTNRLTPGRNNKELFVQSVHEYADSILVDSPHPTPTQIDGAFPGSPMFKISNKRRKSILKAGFSRESSIYTNYIDNTAVLRNACKAEVEYDYIAPIELRIPFRVSWAPLFFNDDFSYVPNMEVAKLLSALNVTNHYNEGWDFEQYQNVVNSKAGSMKPPPPIPPKTASMLRETNKRWHRFRPSLIDTPENETVQLSRYNSLKIARVSFRASFSVLSHSTSTTSSTESCFLEDVSTPSPLPSNRPNSRGTFPSTPILPPYKEVAELPQSNSVSTPYRVDDNGDAITRSYSESKIEYNAPLFPPLFMDTSSQTLNRHQAKEKKMKHCSNSVESKSFTSFDSEGQILPECSGANQIMSTSPSTERDTLHISHPQTILLGEEQIIQPPNSGVSLRTPPCDAIALAKKMGGEETIEITINIFTNYKYWENKLDHARRVLHRDREKLINLSPIVSISCNVSPPPNIGNMLLTIPICGQNGWNYQVLHKDIDNLYTSERKEKPFTLCDDRVEISTSSFGYYCIKGKYQEKSTKNICVKRVVFFGLRMLFKQDRIQIGMCNDTPDDIKIFKEEMHKRHLRAIISLPCHYQLRYIPHPPPLKVSLQVDGHTHLDQKAIPFMSAWKMIPSLDCEGDNPLTPSCTFTLPSSSHTLLLYIKLPHNNIEFSLNS